MYPGIFSDSNMHFFGTLIIYILKLRLKFGFQVIAYFLGVSVATVSWRFNETLDLMTTRLEWLINWPDQEELAACGKLFHFVFRHTTV